MSNEEDIYKIIEAYYNYEKVYSHRTINNKISLDNISRDELINIIINDKYLLRYVFYKNRLDIFNENELEYLKSEGLYKLFDLNIIDDFTKKYNILEEDDEITREFKYINGEIKSIDSYSSYIKPEILKNEKMCMDLIIDSKLALSYIDESLMHDVNFLTRLIKEYKYTGFIPEKYWNDIDFQKAVLKIDDRFFEKCNEEIRNDRNIVFSIVENNPNLYKHIGDSLKNDKELILKIIKNRFVLFEYAGDKLKDDEEFLLHLIAENNGIIKYASNRLLHNLNFLFKAYNVSSNIIKYLPKESDDNFFNNETRTLIRSSKIMTKEDKIAHIMNIQDTYKSSLLEKLLGKYYNEYKNKIVTNNPEKDNYYDFFKVMITSNVLETIYKSNEYSINDTRFIEYFLNDNSILIEYNKIFDVNTRNILKEKIKNYKNKYRCVYLNFYNKLLEKLSKKEDINKLFSEYELDVQNVEIEIISNKYFDSKMKDNAINLLKNYNNKNLNLLDIIVILERMADNKSTISQALDDNNIDSKTFYSIYNCAKDNNPALYQYIRECLNYNKIRGFKKLIYLAYRIIKSNFTTIEEFRKICSLDIEVLLSALKNTELYIPLYDKVKNIFNLNIDEESEKLI